MPVTDPIADMLTRIRNALVARHDYTDVPASKVKLAVAHVLKTEGYIKDFESMADGVGAKVRVHLAYSAKREPMITDLDRHVVDRFLAAPASRLAIVLSQVVRAGITAILQALILLLVALALGVVVHGGALGWLVVCAASALLAMVFSGFSNGVALLLRREASMIVTANFVGLPLMFLSSILLSTVLMPGWISTISRYNPVNWGVHAARNAVVVGGDWGPTGVFLLLLLAATAVTSAFATWTFRAYQRSI